MIVATARSSVGHKGSASRTTVPLAKSVELFENKRVEFLVSAKGLRENVKRKRG